MTDSFKGVSWKSIFYSNLNWKFVTLFACLLFAYITEMIDCHFDELLSMFQVTSHGVLDI